MTKRIKQIADLTPDTANVNRGTERGQSVIDWSLTELGAGRSIVADADGNVLAGNKTMKAAAKLKFPVRVVETDGKELVIVQRTDLRLEGDGPQREKARQLALADNRTQELSYEADIETLLMHAQTVDLGPLYSEDEIDALIASLEPEDVAPGDGGDDFDTTPEETQTRVRKGDLWQLGNHRLLCGDSTKAEDVARVMDGENAGGCITDPPYSVNYDRSQKERGGDTDVHSAFHEASIHPTDLLQFMRIIPCDVLVMSYPVDRHFIKLAEAFKAANLEVRKELIWVKDTFSFWMGAKYQQRHEPILVCAKVGKPVNADVPANQSTVFEIPRPKAHDLHPTMKPMDLWEPLVRYHIPAGGIAFEPFGGSGTTLIACERTNRKARVIEIEPKYCNVILSRWEAETGKEAKLLERVDG